MPVELRLTRLREAVREKKAGLSYTEAAKLIDGVSKQTLHRFTHGSWPDLETFVRLLDWTGLPIEEVLIETAGQGEIFDGKASGRQRFITASPNSSRKRPLPSTK